MKLYQQIDADFLTAYKAHEEAKVGILRLLKSALKNKAIELAKDDLDDAEVLPVLNKEAKMRQESIAQYEAASRPELVEQEKAELDFIQSYLPESTSEGEIKTIVEAVIAETGAISSSDMGKVMGSLKQKLTNPADISTAAKMAAEQLK